MRIERSKVIVTANRWMWWGLLGLFACSTARASNPDNDERVWRHRNLGKAFYENAATQYQAVDEFRRALELAPNSARERMNHGLALLRAGQTEEGIRELETAQKQDPSIPHTWFNLGIEYQRAGRHDEALKQLETMARLVPTEAVTQYNLGVLYKLTGDREKAMAAFRRSSELDPHLAGPRFQLATALRQAKKTDEAKEQMVIFRRLKKRAGSAAVQEDLEWSWFSEILDEIEPRPVAGSPAPLQAKRRLVEAPLDGPSAGLEVVDFDGDGKADVLFGSDRGFGLLQGPIAKPKIRTLGPAELNGLGSWVSADFDNDGRPDVALLESGALKLLRQSEGGRLKPAGGKGLPSSKAFDLLLWLDYDHDYDLDLLAFGRPSALLRNNGDGTWTDRSKDFPFAEGRATAAVTFDVMADSQGMDVAVAYADGPGVLYRDLLGGSYRAEPFADLPSGADQLAAHDLNRDGWSDLIARRGKRATIFFNDHERSFKAGLEQTVGGPMAIADLESDGREDVVSTAGWFRNDGAGSLSRAPLAELGQASARVAVDLDGAGRFGLVQILSSQGQDTQLEAVTFSGVPNHRWITVSLEGVKNLQLAPGAEVEVKAGSLYQKKLYTGAPLTFGLGDRKLVDTVRITWPNGLIQNESKQETDDLKRFKEAQRLSGSCPMIFTWNGEGFQFITDVLGVAPLGAAAGEGEYFPVDHDEWIQIPAGALVEGSGGTEGKLEIRITEELREIAYLDQVRLVALDHSEDLEVFTNDKFKGPPFPEFRLFGVEAKDRRYPVEALDHRGESVRSALLAKDRVYPDAYDRDYAGVAELHSLELDFGDVPLDDERKAMLVLSGWVDWADGSTFRGASQQDGPGLVMPSIQVLDAQGQWQTVVEDMGIPAGKPKTIVVDLTDKFLSEARTIRIVTNLCIYWDEIFLSTRTEAPPLRRTGVSLSSAELRFRGFSKPIIHPERKQPEVFEYASRRDFTMWNPTPGLYTRYGSVDSLLETIDDQYVIMGSGDELVLLFDGADLPPRSEGTQRSYLLFVDGWAKDGDANTAHSQTVGPLPFHGMPQYPYDLEGSEATYPDDPELRRWIEEYNSRPALRLIRPMTDPNPVAWQVD